MKLATEYENLFGPSENAEVPSLCIKQLLRSAWVGTMSSEALRVLCWRMFLGIISSTDKSVWKAQLAQQVVDYDALKLRVLPSVDKVKADPLSAALSSGDDDQTDEWKSYYQNMELISFIKGDLDRLFLNGVEDEFFQTEERRIMLQNILNVWSLQHQNISYRQGMHEIAGIVLFAVEVERVEMEKAKVSHEAFNHHTLHKLFDESTIEAHTFWLFERIMAELHPLYDALPTSSHGMENQPFVVQYSTKIQEHYLRLLDPELCEHLEASYVQSQLYGLRWSRLLLAREFPVDDKFVLRLWDYMFACCYDAEQENRSEPNITSANSSVHMASESSPGVSAAVAAADPASPLRTVSPTPGVTTAPRPLDEDMPPNIYSVLANARLAGHTCFHNINNKLLQKPQPAAKKGRGIAYVVTPLLGVLGDFMLAMMLQVRDILLEADSNIVIGYLMRYPEVLDVRPIIENVDMIRRGVLIREARLGASFLDGGVEENPIGDGGASGKNTPSKGRVPQWLKHPTGGRVSGALLGVKDMMGNQINKMTNKAGRPQQQEAAGVGFAERGAAGASPQKRQQLSSPTKPAASAAVTPIRRRVNSQMDYEDEEDTVPTTGDSVENVLDFDPLGIAPAASTITAAIPSAVKPLLPPPPVTFQPAAAIVAPSKAGFGNEYGGSIKDLLDAPNSSTKDAAGSITSSSSGGLFGTKGTLFGSRDKKGQRLSEDGLPLDLLMGDGISLKTRVGPTGIQRTGVSADADCEREKSMGVSSRISAIADVFDTLHQRRQSEKRDGYLCPIDSLYEEVSARLNALSAVLEHTRGGYSLADYDHKFGSPQALLAAKVEAKPEATPPLKVVAAETAEAADETVALDVDKGSDSDRKDASDERNTPKPVASGVPGVVIAGDLGSDVYIHPPPSVATDENTEVSVDPVISNSGNGGVSATGSAVVAEDIVGW